MITIKFSPGFSRIKRLTASWNSPVLTVNSVDYDLSELADGATAVHDVLLNVAREGDNYMVKLLLPHGKNAPDETLFPVDYSTEAGEISVPKYEVDI